MLGSLKMEHLVVFRMGGWGGHSKPRHSIRGVNGLQPISGMPSSPRGDLDRNQFPYALALKRALPSLLGTLKSSLRARAMSLDCYFV